MMNIGLQPEYVLSVFGLNITNTFLTSLLTSIVILFFIFVFSFKKNSQNIVFKIFQVLVFELLKLIDSVTNNRRFSKEIFPLVCTFFVFIVTANLLALLPGFLGSFYLWSADGRIALLRSPNSDLTTTLALALFSVFSIQLFSLKVLGWKNFLKRFLNLGNPFKFIMGFFELISESVKILSFSFRLFGNIFAGEIVLLIIAFVFPYFIPLPFMILEIFVGVIQAFIFSVLTLTFIKTSTIRFL